MEEDKKGKACREVIKQSRHRVYFELRFLEQALFRLPPEENERIFFGSDGEKLYFDREYLLNRYLQAPRTVSCDCLHTVIHCLYQHPFRMEQEAGEYWDLASDIAVADVLREINVSWITEQIPQECLAIADRVKEEVSMMAAPHIARYLQDTAVKEKGLCGYSYAELAGLFRRDSHACWESAQKDGGRKSADGEKPESQSLTGIKGKTTLRGKGLKKMERQKTLKGRNQKRIGMGRVGKRPGHRAGKKRKMSMECSTKRAGRQEWRQERRRKWRQECKDCRRNGRKPRKVWL